MPSPLVVHNVWHFTRKLNWHILSNLWFVAGNRLKTTCLNFPAIISLLGIMKIQMKSGVCLVRTYFDVSLCFSLRIQTLKDS